MKKLLKSALRILSIILIAMLVNAVIFMGWVAMKPRSVPFIAAELEKVLSGVSGEVKFTIGQTVLQWDGWDRAFGVHLKSVEIADGKGNKLARLPDVAASFRLLPMLIGQIKFSEVRVINPRFEFVLPKVKEVENGEESEAEAVSDNPFLYTYSYGQIFLANELSRLQLILENLPLEAIAFEKVEVLLHTPMKEIIWVLPEVTMNIEEEDSDIHFSARLKSDVWGNVFTFNAKGVLYDSGKSEIDISVYDFYPEAIAEFIPFKQWIRALGLSVDANLALVLTPEDGLSAGQFGLTTEVDGMQVSVLGDVTNYTLSQYISVPDIKMAVQLENLLYNDLMHIWPEDLLEDPRSWLQESTANGLISYGEANLHISPEDVLKQQISKSALEAFIHFDGVDVNYNPLLPSVSGAAGIVHIDGDSLDILVHEGKMADNSVVISDHIQIFNLMSDLPNMQVDGVVEGDIQDLFPFFELSQGEGLKEISGKLSGQARTRFHFEFPLLKDLPYEALKFKTTAQLSNVSIKGLSKGIDLTGGNMTMKANDKSYAIKGNALLNGVSTAIFYSESLTSAEPSVEYTASMYAKKADLEKFGMPAMAFVDGGMAINVAGKQNGKKKAIALDVNLTDTELDLQPVGWKKSKGEKGSLSLNLSSKDGVVATANDVLFKAKGANAKGAAKVNLKAGALTSLDFKDITLGDRHYSLQVKEDGKGYKADATADYLNIAPFVQDIGKSDEDWEGLVVPVRMTYSVDTLEMAQKEILSNVEGSLFCHKQWCTEAQMNADFANKTKLDFSITPNTEGSRLVVKAGDAGRLLRGFDLADNIHEGNLETSADITYKDKKASIEGKLALKDFYVKQAPVLAKLLSLASLSGVLNTLNGEGIYFDKAGAEYTKEGDKFILKKSKASGSAIGLTVEGEANTKTKEVLMRGHVVPAYSLNKILGSVPVLGDLLIGGEGEGIVAVRYKIVGKYTDPEVETNPLSALTPGFLRNIWGDVSDTKLPEASKNKPEVKKKSEEVKQP